MAQLKAFTTIEAIISSVLILIAFSISTMIYLNVMHSHPSVTRFDACSMLLELSRNDENREEQNYELFYVSRTIKNYQDFPDLKELTWTAYNRQDQMLCQLKQVIKTSP